MSTTPFSGEPVRGLQIMGMLETRLLNYKNIIITSVNEGILPVGNNNNSFIPYEIKKANELQTFKEKDAVFAYHFYRLIQRSHNVWLIYDTEPSALNNGEQSRFITQIEVEGTHAVNRNLLTPRTTVKQKIETSYNKTKLVKEKLQTIIEKGVSASMLCLYVLDKVKFFENYILGLKEESIEETITSSTIGNIVHDSLEFLYKEYVAKELRIEDLERMKNIADKTVKNITQEYVRKENMEKGKNVIVVETVKQYVKRVIELDHKTLKAGNTLKIIDVEKEFESNINEGNIKIKLRGKIDRIDEINGEVRIIDYKSGKRLVKRDLNIKGKEEFNEIKGIYNLQLLVYMLGINEEFKEVKMKSGIINLKNTEGGFLEGNFNGISTFGKKELEDYKSVIILLIKDILNKDINFKN